MTTPAGLGLLAAVTVAVMLLMWWGWRRRTGRWAATITALPQAPAGRAPVFGPVEATYLATTPVGQVLERVPVRGLRVRTPAVVDVDRSGVLVHAGSGDLYLPAPVLVGAGAADGIAGTAVGRGDLVMIRWRAGAEELQTGLLPRHDADRAALTEAVNALVAQPREDDR
jgi:hypothetical protein